MSIVCSVAADHQQTNRKNNNNNNNAFFHNKAGGGEGTTGGEHDNNITQQEQEHHAPTAVPGGRSSTSNVVTRIRQAVAARAAAAAAATTTASAAVTSAADATGRQQLQNSSLSSTPRLGSLLQLTKAIDEQLILMRTSRSSSTSTTSPARDSMAALVLFNRQGEERGMSTTGAATTPPIPDRPPMVTRQVAIVFSKPLKNDVITAEYACRVQRLTKALYKEAYLPDVICFIGGYAGGDHISGADAGYSYFRHLCASHDISLREVGHIYLERTSVEDGALDRMAHYLQQTCMPIWWERAYGEKYIEGTTALNGRRSRLNVHFALFSSDYHLCQLNDIHTRSPSSSKLRALENCWKYVDTAWTYRYASTVPVLLRRLRRQHHHHHHTGSANAGPVGHSDNDDTVIRDIAARPYRTAQLLLPVLQNLRGVVDHKEFFQRDNYRVLVSARRSLVTDMEDMYQTLPSLKAVRRVVLSSEDASALDHRPLDVVLESALLSMGRCLDLVRPAGLLTGTVPMHEWKLALKILQQAVEQITKTCDPDQPLDPSEWGKLVDDSDDDLNCEPSALVSPPL